MGGTVLWTLSAWDSLYPRYPQPYHYFLGHGRAWRWAHHWRAWQGHRRFLKRESSFQWWHPTRGYLSSASLPSLSLSTSCSLWWKGGAVPQDMRDATIIVIYYNNSHPLRLQQLQQSCGISLMSMSAKSSLARSSPDCKYHACFESECGFLAERSTTDMIFTVHQLQEKVARTGLAALYLASINLAKAFDLMGRNGLFQLLRKIGWHPKHLVSYHESMRGTVSCDEFTSDPSPIKSGVKQGCLMKPRHSLESPYPSSFPMPLVPPLISVD